MELLLLSLCLVHLSGSTFADRNGPVIRVKEGNDVTLPCYIKNKNIVSERFEWKKDGKKDVYLCERDSLSGQDKEFKGRVSHFASELKNGNASIKIRDTKVPDSGDYTCHLGNDQIFSVRLVVDKVAKLQIEKDTKVGSDGVLLQCLVSNASPDFQLNISWFDSSGNKLTEQINNTQSGKIYILKTTVKKSDDYRCVATMDELSHQVDDYVTVKDEDLKNTSGSNIPLIIGLVALAVLALIIVVLVIYILRIRKRI
ncbi:butyrophilin subfamily 1 member A1-like isoform X2 [Betta splendens]|uniref:Butyrophilin subfamily 1 member A1-like isoform X2 n=1 Tax=Betta splendens TaxID=158456 RepID=A0A9W2XUA7_BETSP|nr:butyrophilin subfamily 1 member A1-like isoform X2 [Betta splendens]